MRTVDELLDVPEPAWPAVMGWIGASTRPVTVLARDAEASARCLYRLQVTTRSVLGALAYESGGLLVDSGWLRLLGGGPQLPDLASASGLGEPADGSSPPPFLVVGFDVLGGRFAVNGGGLPGEAGEACFYAADTLQWEPLGMGHAHFVEWALTGDLEGFYADLRWPGWQQEVQALGLEQGLSLWPPPFTAEASADPAGTSRHAVPFGELLSFHDDLAGQVTSLPDGEPFQIEARD